MDTITKSRNDYIKCITNEKYKLCKVINNNKLTNQVKMNILYNFINNLFNKLKYFEYIKNYTLTNKYNINNKSIKLVKLIVNNIIKLHKKYKLNIFNKNKVSANNLIYWYEKKTIKKKVLIYVKKLIRNLLPSMENLLNTKIGYVKLDDIRIGFENTKSLNIINYKRVKNKCKYDIIINTDLLIYINDKLSNNYNKNILYKLFHILFIHILISILYNIYIDKSNTVNNNTDILIYTVQYCNINNINNCNSNNHYNNLFGLYFLSILNINNDIYYILKDYIDFVYKNNYNNKNINIYLNIDNILLNKTYIADNQKSTNSYKIKYNKSKHNKFIKILKTKLDNNKYNLYTAIKNDRNKNIKLPNINNNNHIKNNNNNIKNNNNNNIKNNNNNIKNNNHIKNNNNNDNDSDFQGKNSIDNLTAIPIVPTIKKRDIHDMGIPILPDNNNSVDNNSVNNNNSGKKSKMYGELQDIKKVDLKLINIRKNNREKRREKRKNSKSSLDNLCTLYI